MTTKPAPTDMLIGAILIGGKSQRMGRPKQLAMYQGSPLLHHVIDVLSPHVERILCVGSGALPDGMADTTILPDTAGVDGPLAGVHKARQFIPSNASLLLCACDMPLIQHEAIAWLLNEQKEAHSAIIPRLSHGGLEPLFALYEPASLGLLETLINRGQSALSLLAQAHAVHTPTPPEHLEISWTNINSPADLDRLQQGDFMTKRECKLGP